MLRCTEEGVGRSPVNESPPLNLLPCPFRCYRPKLPRPSIGCSPEPYARTLAAEQRADCQGRLSFRCTEGARKSPSRAPCDRLGWEGILGALACRLSGPRMPVRRGGRRPASLEGELPADSPQAPAWLRARTCSDDRRAGILRVPPRGAAHEPCSPKRLKRRASPNARDGWRREVKEPTQLPGIRMADARSVTHRWSMQEV